MEEEAGVAPMLETIRLKSCGEMTSRIKASTRATSPSVTVMREPEGALRLMVNMPASVRGKNERPRRGNRARLEMNNNENAARVNQGCFNAPETRRS